MTIAWKLSTKYNLARPISFSIKEKNIREVRQFPLNEKAIDFCYH